MPLVPRPGRLTSVVLDPQNPRSVSALARAGRWAKFQQVFPEITRMRVLDLGGMPSYWTAGPVRPAHVVTVNLWHADRDEPWIDHRQGDVLDLPASASGDRFDLVVSNSLLEHLGGHANRQRFADIVRAAGPRHWVQTPYRYFPLEPHWMFPGLQFLPFAARVAVTKRWRGGHMQADTDEQAVSRVNEVELVGLRQMRAYYPESTVWLERMLGLPKSMVAIRA